MNRPSCYGNQFEPGVLYYQFNCARCEYKRDCRERTDKMKDKTVAEMWVENGCRGYKYKPVAHGQDWTLEVIQFSDQSRAYWHYTNKQWVTSDPIPQEPARGENIGFENELLTTAGQPPFAGYTQAEKKDNDKPTPELLPFAALVEVSEVLAYGARKYAAHNWRKGLLWSRLLGAALRHLFAWGAGQDKDPETGYSHLAHATCCCLFLLDYECTGGYASLDDRAKGKRVD